MVTSVAGKTYSFKVSATNAVGEGALSSQFAIIAAEIPASALNLVLVSQDTT